MDKYLFIILILLIAGMAFSIFKNPPSIDLFYAQLAGAFIIIAYSTYKNRKNTKTKKRRD
ncbi:MAG: hypothetical protein ABI337_00375 [Nitrososphaera sp.]